MEKSKFVCPFTNKTCHECALYRGRHCFIDNHLQEKAQRRKPADIKANFQALSEALTPEVDAGARAGEMPLIALRVVDVENGTSEVCPLEEAD
jgi:hypothetical protein